MISASLSRAVPKNRILWTPPEVVKDGRVTFRQRSRNVAEILEAEGLLGLLAVRDGCAIAWTTFSIEHEHPR